MPFLVSKVEKSDEGCTNYGLQAKLGPPPCSVDVFMGHSYICSFIYAFPMAVFLLQTELSSCEGDSMAYRTIIFTTWSFIEILADPWSRLL